MVTAHPGSSRPRALSTAREADPQAPSPRGQLSAVVDGSNRVYGRCVPCSALERLPQHRELLGQCPAGQVGQHLGDRSSRQPALLAATGRRLRARPRPHSPARVPAPPAACSCRWTSRVRSWISVLRYQVSSRSSRIGLGARSWGGPASARPADRSRPRRPRRSLVHPCAWRRSSWSSSSGSVTAGVTANVGRLPGPARHRCAPASRGPADRQ